MELINWTNQASLWLRDIYEYLAQDNALAAAQVACSLYENAQILAARPAAGKRQDWCQKRQVRVLHCGDYRFAYLITDAGSVVILSVATAPSRTQAAYSTVTSG